MFAPIEKWFQRNGWTPFAFQRETWQAYLAGQSGLVHAPTGMGKTYAVWLGPLIEWMKDALQTSTDESIVNRQSSIVNSPALRMLWITPLRALAGDTAENLRAATQALNIPWRIEIRTGDTSASLRKKQREQLPEALITTPESLSVLLSYPKSSDHFTNLRCIIVDEWHELMGTKRGVQTELGLARLRLLSPRVRTWGLSATLGNLDQAMGVLMGSQSPKSKIPKSKGDQTAQTLDFDHLDFGLSAGTLVRGDHSKDIVVETLRPDDIERFPWSGHVGLKLLPQVIAAIEAARTTLLFTNVRSQAETWFQQIIKARPDLIGHVALHHGSLDREIRTKVEDLLRQGKIRCVVCTSSLDLGVDFTPVDQVMQLGSPKGIARMLQRAGRSGHQPGAVSRILGVPTNALELIEFAAARDAVGRKIQSPNVQSPNGSDRRALDFGALDFGLCGPAVESRIALERPLDVLVQHLVTLAAGDGFEPDQLRDEVRSTHAFHNITDEEWQWAVDFISQGGPALHAYPQYARVMKNNGQFTIASKEIERLHRMSIGTITSETAMNVAFVGGATLGTIEESFIARLRPGDRFVFAGRVLQLVRVQNLVAYVTKATRRSGIIPRWMGGRCPLSNLLSEAVRRKLDEARRGIFNSPEMELVRPLLELQARWSAIPQPDELLIERSHSRDGHHVFVFPFDGRQVHEGLSSLIAHRIASRAACSMHVTANDYGFELLAHEPIEIDEAGWRDIFNTDNLVHDLLGCLNTTALARRQFREIARVAGLIFSGYPGQPKSARHLQASSQMFFDVFSQFDPANLLLDQAKREVLDRELEVTRLRDTLERISRSRFLIIDLPADRLTPLGFPIWAERIRTQHITSEKWSDRIKRMVVMLEAHASQAQAKSRNGRKSKVQMPKCKGHHV